uniref:Uncharacterized protein n=1 Tax=Coccolithus braarudii TaxID=221442 RepID=A0A7S0L3D3_9EUKA
MVLSARLKLQSSSTQSDFLQSLVSSHTVPMSSSSGSLLSKSATEIAPSDSVSQLGGGGGGSSDSCRIAELEQRLKEAEAGRSKDRVDAQGRCRFCLRSECSYIQGWKPCREFWQAVNYLGEKRSDRRKQREAEAGQKKDDE